MKGKLSNTTVKSTSVSNNGSLPHMSRDRFVSALIRFSMKKRKLENEENRHCARQILVATCNGVVPRAKKMRNSITREEMLSIQTQLAILSDGDGDRPIHIAVANEDIKLVHKLCVLMVNNSISLDITNYLRQTPLHLSVILGNTDIIKLLLRFGASPLVSDRNGNSVLHLAVKSNSIKDVFHTLLSPNQVKNILNSMDYEGYSPLHYAVFKKNFDAVEVLHSYGADMNKIDGKSGRTPLIHAVLDQNTDMVEQLLKLGACPQKPDYSGRSAFDMALQIANVQIVKLLEKSIPQNEISAAKEQNKPTLQHSTKIKRTKSQN